MKKFKFLIIALTTFVLVGVVGVSATEYGDEFKLLTSDGTVKVPVMNDFSRDQILSNYLYSLSTDEYWFSADYEACSDDYTVCTVVLDFADGRDSEPHEVRISYEEVYTDEFAVITDDGKVTIETTYIKDPGYWLPTYIASYSNDVDDFYLETCNEDYSACRIVRSSKDGMEYEIHDVEITYKEVYSDTFSVLTDNGKLELETTNIVDVSSWLSTYIYSFSDTTYDFNLGTCNEDYSVCEISMVVQDGTEADYELHDIEITYKEVYSDEFENLLTKGNLVVPVMNLESKAIILGNYLNSLWTDEISYEYDNCNEDYTKCNIRVFSMEQGLYEQHEVNISYKEVYSDEFKSILSDGKLVISESSLDEDKIWIIRQSVSKFDTEEYSFNVDSCNEDYSICIVTKNSMDGYEQHEVDVVYEEQYSDLYKILTKDGNITITSSTVGEVSELLWSYLNNYWNDDFGFNLGECNEDYTKCTISLYDNKTYNSESHVINIKYEEQYSELFKNVIVDGKLVIPSIKPKNHDQAEFFLQNYLNTISTASYEYSPGNCNEDYSICDIVVYAKMANGQYYSESHKAAITYAELDKNKADQVNKVLTNLPNDKTFVVEDLEIINYLINSGYTNDDLWMSSEAVYINYSTELKRLLGNSNITATLDIRGGSFPIFIQENIGGYIVSYDGVAYGLFHGGAIKKYVIYIPDETTESTDAYIKAAQDRLDAYLGKGKVELSYAGKLSELEESDHELLGYGNKLRDEYFTLTYGDYEFNFLIVKDSSKMQEIGEQITNDVMTNISISMNSSVLPLDTSITVDEISKDNQKYVEITDKLNDNKYNVDHALIYDLKLYSLSNKDYITKLEDGTFEVKIPVSKDLEGKELIVYYVNEDGKVDEHEVFVKDGYATFKTNHFSIYTLAEKKPFVFENPNTFDGISTYFILGFVSFMGLVGTLLYSKKMSNKKDC